MLPELSQPETYDELLPKLSPAMYSASEFREVNNTTINTLRWKADKPSDFAIKGNFKHIFESLGWYTDAPISIKDKDGKIVTATGNFACINNSKPEPMLCLDMTWIRKVQGILDPNKNQFQIKLHGKTYTIPTFSKATELACANRDREIAIECGNQLSNKCSVLNKNNKHIQRNLKQSNKDKEKLSKHAFQLKDEVKRLRSELNNLTFQITHKDISLKESKIKIKDLL
ncbi:6677_t:CDS:2, partial [Cetraspora pellucida]